MNFPNRQSGVAMLIVLLIVAIVVILATEMAGRMQLNVQRIQNIKDNNQAQWYAYSAEEFARKSIQDVFRLSSDKIHIEQPWSQEFTFPMEGGGIQAQLVDMQSCFNLNALANITPEKLRREEITEQMRAFDRLLQSVDIEEPIDVTTRETVRDSLADWLDTDQRPRPFGAEDSEYESREFPYLAANGLMASQSELRVINGVDSTWLNQIWELVCVIPNSSDLAININTLTPDHSPLLAGLTGLSREQANDVIGSRPRDGWDAADDIFNNNVFDSVQITDEQRGWFTVNTEYFILHTQTRYNNASFSLSTLFQISNGSTVTVIRREFGGMK